MTCPDCSREVEQFPCVCGYQEKEWTNALYDKPQVRETYVPLPGGISCDEFGVDLFAAIKHIGGMSALQEHIALAVHRGEGWKIQGYRARRTELEKHLRVHMSRLSGADRDAIFDRYPWVEATLKVNP